mmetsp:Transcript_10399/g.20632  ORF Transcript_10399/g.20632 Transcript_10399/m.20632 type:complete len:101 (-) Transcript_10399:847-1149(-)
MLNLTITQVKNESPRTVCHEDSTKTDFQPCTRAYNLNIFGLCRIFGCQLQLRCCKTTAQLLHPGIIVLFSIDCTRMRISSKKRIGRNSGLPCQPFFTNKQ